MTLGRPLIADAEWVNKVMAGDLKHIRPCINCTEGDACLKADLYVCALGQRSCIPAFAADLASEGICVKYIGDAKKAGKVIDAVSEGFYAGYDA